MIHTCNWYQNDRQGKQNSISWPNLICYITKFGGKFKVSMSVSKYSTNRAYRSGDCTCKMHGNDGLDEQNSDTWPNLISHSIILAGRNLLTFTSDLFLHHCASSSPLSLGSVSAVLLRGRCSTQRWPCRGPRGHVGEGQGPRPRFVFDFAEDHLVLAFFPSSSRLSPVSVSFRWRLIMWRRCSSYWRWWRYKASGEGPFWC